MEQQPDFKKPNQINSARKVNSASSTPRLRSGGDRISLEKCASSVLHLIRVSAAYLLKERYIIPSEAVLEKIDSNMGKMFVFNEKHHIGKFISQSLVGHGLIVEIVRKNLRCVVISVLQTTTYEVLEQYKWEISYSKAEQPPFGLTELRAPSTPLPAEAQHNIISKISDLVNNTKKFCRGLTPLRVPIGGRTLRIDTEYNCLDTPRKAATAKNTMPLPVPTEEVRVPLGAVELPIAHVSLVVAICDAGGSNCLPPEIANDDQQLLPPQSGIRDAASLLGPLEVARSMAIKAFYSEPFPIVSYFMAKRLWFQTLQWLRRTEAINRTSLANNLGSKVPPKTVAALFNQLSVRKIVSKDGVHVAKLKKEIEATKLLLAQEDFCRARGIMPNRDSYSSAQEVILIPNHPARRGTLVTQPQHSTSASRPKSSSKSSSQNAVALVTPRAEAPKSIPSPAAQLRALEAASDAAQE